MKKRMGLVLALLSIFLMSCQMLNGGLTKGLLPGSSPKVDRARVKSIFTPPADPLSASVKLDAGKSVQKTIPITGGEIQAEGADGTLYTLNIPGTALENETTIKMTPAEVTGLPFGKGQTLAVQMEPDGLNFLDFVTLTILPKKAIPLEQQISFGFQSGGKDVILVPPDVKSSEIKLKLLHFSGAGVTTGLLADIEPVRERLGGNAERRIQSEVAEKVMIEHQRQMLGSGEKDSSGLFEILDAAFAQYEKEVLAPRLAAAGESCAAGRLAIQTAFGLERQKQLVGAGDENGLSKYAGLIDTVSKVCMKEEYELCANQHIIHRIIPVWLGMERQRQLLGSGNSPLFKEGEDLVKKCLTFELQFHSEASFDAGDRDGYNSTVDAKIPLHFDPGKMNIIGKTALVNKDFEFRNKGCNVTSQRGGSTVEVASLIPITDTKTPQDELGYVRDFKLLFFPERTSEVFSVTCPDTPTYTSPPSGLWSAIYLVLHAGEIQQNSDQANSDPGSSSPPPTPDISSMIDSATNGFSMPVLSVPMISPGGGFLVTDWEVFGKEYFAKKEWIKDDASTGITETGTLKLYHRPGG